mgnify:CR=1 FL=1
MLLKAVIPIHGVTMIPCYDPSEPILPVYQKNVAVLIKTTLGAPVQCGVFIDYSTTYTEVDCHNIQGNEIVAEQQSLSNDLLFCGFGVLADCDCVTSSFDPFLFTTTPLIKFASITSLLVKSTDSIQTILFNS